MRLPDSLRCLANRNLRLFFGGQAISLVGTWMQSVAVQWLVWRLTHSPVVLGQVAFLSQLPVLFLAAAAGGLADRVSRKRLVIATQLLATFQALAMWALAREGALSMPLVYALSLVAGLAIALEMPARQALLSDLAGPEMLNAIAFNSTLVHSTRVIGPAIGGVLVAWLGEAPCFLANAVSYLPVLWSLGMIRVEAPPARPGRGGGGLREGFRYAWHTPHVGTLLVTVAAMSLFGLSFNAVLQPVFAQTILGGGPGLLGVLFSAGGAGALFGAILLLRQKGLVGLVTRVAWGASLLSVSLVAFAWSRSIPFSCAAQFLIGLGFMSVLASANTLLQSLAEPGMRGRVMGLFSMAFMGMAPIGSVVAGWLAGWLGPRMAVTAGAGLILAKSLHIWLTTARLQRIVGRYETAGDSRPGVPPDALGGAR